MRKSNELKPIMTEEEQYNKLLTIEDKLLFFNQHNEVTLEQDDLTLLKELYKVYFPEFRQLNTTCSSCIREFINVCISRYSALKEQFGPVVEPLDGNTEIPKPRKKKK